MINAKYKISYREYLQTVFRLTYRRAMPIIMIFSGFFFLGHFFFLLIWKEIFAVLDIDLFLFTLIYYPLIILYSTKRNYNSTKSLSEESEIHFSNEEISIINTTGQSTYTWEGLFKVVETKEMFLFYQSINIAVFVPKRIIQDIEGLKMIISENYKGKLPFK